MTEGSIVRQVLLFSLPLMLGNVFQMLYNTVDSVVVGNFVGTEALAAVGATTMIINMLVFFFNGFATGAGVLIHMDWQASDGLGENPDAGIDCSHLHSASFIDGFARAAATKEKTVGATIGAIGGLVSGMKQS